MTSADLPYDTDIPDDGADIPEDPNEAFRANAMKITRINSVNQVILFNFVLPGDQSSTINKITVVNHVNGSNYFDTDIC